MFFGPLNWVDAALKDGRVQIKAILPGRVCGFSSDSTASSDMAVKVTLEQAVRCGWH